MDQYNRSLIPVQYSKQQHPAPTAKYCLRLLLGCNLQPVNCNFFFRELKKRAVPSERKLMRLDPSAFDVVNKTDPFE